jgi:hypothetical protein
MVEFHAIKNEAFCTSEQTTENIKSPTLSITRNMGQDGDGHAHFDQIWRPNITINYMGVDQNIKF